MARRAELQERCAAPGPGDGTELTPSWNVAPTSKVYAVVERGRDGAGTVREVRAVRWGPYPDEPRPRRREATHTSGATRFRSSPGCASL